MYKCTNIYIYFFTFYLNASNEPQTSFRSLTPEPTGSRHARICICYLHIFRVRNVCTSAHVMRILAYAPISVHGMRCYANARISGELMCVRYCRRLHSPWVRLLLSRRVLGLFKWHLVALQQLLTSLSEKAPDLRAKQYFLYLQARYWLA